MALTKKDKKKSSPDKKPKQKVSSARSKKSSSTRLKFADLFTLGNASLGLLSIISAAYHGLILAALLILGAMIMDFLDGKVARLMKTQNALGKQLDSLADIVSFGVAPSMLAYAIFDHLIMLAIVAVFISCGIVRLAKFNIQDFPGFRGMPITINGLIFPLLAISNLPSIVFPIVMMISSVLMVSPFRLKKIL